MGPRRTPLTRITLGCLFAAGLCAGALNAKTSAGTYSSATLTVYRKGAAPIVDTFPTIKSISFTGQSRVLPGKVLSIVHAMQVRPAKGAILFNLRGMPGTAGVIKLYTLNGREIYSRDLKLNGAGARRMAVPTVSGFYIVRFTNGTSTLTQSVMSYN